MKILLSILMFFFLFSCQHRQAGTVKADGLIKNAGVPEFEFQQEFHNFGTLQAGEMVAFGFAFKNTGSAGLIIEKVESDCGCVQVEYPRESIKPGETTYIEVLFNSAGEVGKVYKTITIFSNTEKKEVSLAIAAIVENKILNLYSKN